MVNEIQKLYFNKFLANIQELGAAFKREGLEGRPSQFIYSKTFSCKYTRAQGGRLAGRLNRPPPPRLYSKKIYKITLGFLMKGYDLPKGGLKLFDWRLF